MKKKLITLAVAAAFAPALALADVTVYGQAHMSVDSNSGNGTTAGGATQNGTQIASNSSRLGFKGTVDLSDGMKALFQYESGVDLTGKGNGTDGNGGKPSNSIFSNARDSFIGLAGGVGTVMAGRLPLANQYVYDVNFFADQVGDSGNFAVNGNIAGGRVNSAIAYATPEAKGFSGLIAFVPNTQESVGMVQNSVNKQSSYTLRGTYSAGPVFASASYQNIGVAGVATTMLNGAKLTVASVAATYDYGVGKAGLQLTSNGANSQANNGGASTTQNVFTAGASFKVSEAGTVKAQYNKAEATSGANNGGSMIAVGYDHGLNKTTTIYVAIAKVSNDANSSFSATGFGHGGVGNPAVIGSSPSVLSIGEIYAF